MKLLVLLAFAVGAARRLLMGWDAPLWLDEIFTGTIAIQPSFAGLIADILNELGGPFYYFTMWVWVKAFGASDIMLRLPSLIFAFGAPLLIYLRGHPDPVTRYFWAALVALWAPGFFYASEARGYTLLFFLGCLQVIHFRKLLTTPTLRPALLWAVVSALLILTHYYAMVLVGLQSLGYLALQRSRALRTWPAAMVFVPVAALMMVHLPLHLRFAAFAWQEVLQPRDATWIVHLLLGIGYAGSIPLVAIVFTVGRDLYESVRGRGQFPFDLADVLSVGASLAAALFIFGLAFFRPSFVPRYLLAFIPGILLGLALWAREWGRRWWPTPYLLLAPFLTYAAVDLANGLTAVRRDFRHGYSWDEASRYLAHQRVQRLIFLWDSPTAALPGASLLSRVGSFYFDRAGYALPKEHLLAKGSDQALREALISAASRPAAQGQTVGTLTLGRRLDLGKTDPRWTCRVFDGNPYGADVFVSACYRGPAAGLKLRSAHRLSPHRGGPGY